MSTLRRNNLREALRSIIDWHKDCKCHGCRFGASVLKDSHGGCEPKADRLQKLVVTNARTRLWAYCGNKEANAEWITGLLPLVEAAGVLECPVRGCREGSIVEHISGSSGLAHDFTIVKDPCSRCNGTGKVTDEHALLRLCLAVAWECYEVWIVEDHEGECAKDGAYDCPFNMANDALYGCQAYLDDPTEERRRAWGKTLDAFSQAPPDWIPFPFSSFMEHPKAPKSKKDYLASLLNAAAGILGNRFRAVVLGRVGSSNS